MSEKEKSSIRFLVLAAISALPLTFIGIYLFRRAINSSGDSDLLYIAEFSTLLGVFGSSAAIVEIFQTIKYRLSNFDGHVAPEEES